MTEAERFTLNFNALFEQLTKVSSSPSSFPDRLTSDERFAKRWEPHLQAEGMRLVDMNSALRRDEDTTPDVLAIELGLDLTPSPTVNKRRTQPDYDPSSGATSARETSAEYLAKFCPDETTPPPTESSEDQLSKTIAEVSARTDAEFARAHLATYGIVIAAPTPAPSTDIASWLRAKCEEHANKILAGRTTNGAPLHKASHMVQETEDPGSRMRKVFRTLADQAAAKGVQIEYVDSRALVDAMSAGDEDAFCNVAERVAKQIRGAALAA